MLQRGDWGSRVTCSAYSKYRHKLFRSEPRAITTSFQHMVGMPTMYSSKRPHAKMFKVRISKRRRSEY